MYTAIRSQSDKYSISYLCSAYGVSRSGYYKWLRRQGTLNCYERFHKILDTLVLDLHSHHPMMGYRSLRDMMEIKFGWHISDLTI